MMTRALLLALVKQNASTVAVETAIAQHAANRLQPQLPSMLVEASASICATGYNQDLRR